MKNQRELLVALWGEDLPIQRCTVHKHRNLLAHAPEHVQDELTEDYRDMVYADSADEVEQKRKTLPRSSTSQGWAHSPESVGG